MCTLCITNPFYYGEVAPGIILIRARRADSDSMDVKDWGLLQVNHPDIVFKTTPHLYEEGRELDKAVDSFVSEVVTDIETGYEYYNKFSQVEIAYAVKRLFVKYRAYGFSEKLYFYLAWFINKSEPNTDPDPLPTMDDSPDVVKDYNFDPKSI
jgi:hypothetical protein